MRLSLNRLAFIFVFLTATSCGGGSENQTTEATTLELVTITLEVTGPNDFTIEEGQTVTVSGSAELTNSSNPISYQWREFSTEHVTFFSGSSPTTRITAGQVDQDTEILLEFSATTNDFERPVGVFVTVTVIDTNPTPNELPSISAGEVQTVFENETVNLTGVASDTDGTITSAFWSQVSGASVEFQPENGEGNTLIFIAPNVVDSETALVFEFEFSATDDQGGTDSARTTVTVQAIPNEVPLLETVDDFSMPENSESSLTATAEDSDGAIVSYQWEQLSGISTQLSTPSSATTRILAPDLPGLEPQDLVFEIVVTDNEGAITSNQVTVTITESNDISAISDADMMANRVIETASIGSPVGLTAQANDISPSDSINYQLGDNPNNLFSIDENNGVVTLNSELDFDAQTTHRITIGAISTDGSISEREFNINVLSSDSQKLQVDFPMNNGIFLEDSITIRGRINDPDISNSTVEISNEDETVRAILRSNGDFILSDLVLQSVNGISTLNILVNHSDGSDTQETIELNTNPPVEAPLNSHYNEVRSVVYVVDRSLQSLFEIDIESGIHRKILTNASISMGSRRSTYDAINQRIYVSSLQDAYVINIEQELISPIIGDSIGSGDTISDLKDIAVSSNGERIFVSADNGTAIYEIDETTLNRSLVSGEGGGLGPSLQAANSIIFHDETQTLYAYDVGPDPAVLYTIDANPLSDTFGDRTSVSVGNIGGGSDRGWSGQIVPDFQNNRLFLWEMSSNRAYDEFDIVTKARIARSVRSYSVDPDIGIGIEDTRYIQFEGSNNRFLAIDARLGGLLSFNHSTSDVSLISPMHLSSGRSFNSPRDVDVNLSNDRYFVSDFFRSTVWEVDARTGDRAAPNIFDGSTRVVNNPLGIDYSAEQNSIAVVNSPSGDPNKSVSLLNLDNSTAQLVSSNELNEGPDLISPSDIVIDNANDRLLVSDSGIPAILSIDIDNGDRTIFSGDDLSFGGYLNMGGGLQFSGNRLLLASKGNDTIEFNDIDLNNGFRTLVSTMPSQAFSFSWAFNFEDEIAYISDGSSLIAKDLASDYQRTIAESVEFEPISLGARKITWDPLSNNLFLVSGSRHIVVIDSVSGNRMIVSQ